MLKRKSQEDYPRRDIAPEHTKRDTPDHKPMHPELAAAYQYVESVVDTSDFTNVQAWFGWALREAYLAGITYGKNGGLTQ